MSQSPEAHKIKKRKHSAVAGEGAGSEPSSKRSRKDKGEKKDIAKEHKKAKRDKSKGRAIDDAFRVVRASLSVSVPPVFATDLRGGVEEMLDSMLMRYIPALQGVVLAHDRLEFLDRVATVKADCPFANCRVAFDATVWSPQVGMTLEGKINLCSPDHISLLVHRTFNVSIPRHHITTDVYEFEYGPAENDPEFGAGADAPTDDGSERENGKSQNYGDGRWIHKVTGTSVGAPSGHLEFTVVGLTIANQMLSLVGSIQPDPFSIEHTPSVTVATSVTQRTGQPPSAHMSEWEVDAMIEDEDEDLFTKLGRMGDEAKLRVEEAQEVGKKLRKHKRKEHLALQDARVDVGVKRSKKGGG